MELTDYFKPLNLQLVIFTATTLLFFDVLGSWFDRLFIKSPETYRPAIWLYGLGLFILLWFGLHFYIPFRSTTILLSALPLVLIAGPGYIRHRSWLTLINYLKANLPIVLMIGILLPALWIKASLPPYLTDEVNYHFLSPFDVRTQLSWDFDSPGDLYSYTNFFTFVPKIFDTLFWLPFAITKTYAPSRLIHIAIIFSATCAIYSWLKKRFGHLSANLFALIYLYLMPDLLVIGTSGYIDFSVGAVIALAIISLIDPLFTGDFDKLTTSAIFWGLAIGNKYASLSAFIFFPVLFLLFKGILRTKDKISPKVIIISTLLVLLFGGYWYIKNSIYTLNPIYPFLFDCRITPCTTPAEANNFDSFATQVTLSNLPAIFSDIVSKKIPLLFLSILAIFLIITKGGRKEKTVFSIFSLGVLLELILGRYFSGFVIRYLHYFQILLVIITVLPVNLSKIYRYCLFAFVVFNFAQTMKTTYGVWHYLSPQEIYYTFGIGGTNIKTWIKDRLPQNKDLAFWCGEPGEKTLYVIDRTILIPPTREQHFLIFNVNCQLAKLPAGQTYQDLLNAKTPLMLASTSTCQVNLDEPDNSERLYNQLVCNSQTVGKNLFLFDPGRLD